MSVAISGGERHQIIFQNCCFDPIPISLAKATVSILPVIMKIVNHSLASHTVPHDVADDDNNVENWEIFGKYSMEVLLYLQKNTKFYIPCGDSLF